MSNELIVMERLPLQVQGVSTIMENGKLNEAQRNVIQNTLGKGCPKEDLDLFFWTAEKYGLNPFGVAQIFAVPRKQDGQQRLVTQVGINGLVKIAERSGQFRGMTLPEWCRVPRVDGKPDPDAEPRWRNVWLYDEPPDAAKVGVWRANGREPSWGIALWRESADLWPNGEGKNLWKTKPALMLAKTAAAIALRRTFQAEFAELRASFEPLVDEVPRYRAEISDVYGPDMESVLDRPRARPAVAAPLVRGWETIPPNEEALAQRQAPAAPAKPQPASAAPRRPLSDGQLKLMHSEAKRLLGWEHDALHTYVCERYGLESITELDLAQVNELLSDLKGGRIKPSTPPTESDADPLPAEPCPGCGQISVWGDGGCANCGYPNDPLAGESEPEQGALGDMPPPTRQTAESAPGRH